MRLIRIAAPERPGEGCDIADVDGSGERNREVDHDGKATTGFVPDGQNHATAGIQNVGSRPPGDFFNLARERKCPLIPQTGLFSNGEIPVESFDLRTSESAEHLPAKRLFRLALLGCRLPFRVGPFPFGASAALFVPFPQPPDLLVPSSDGVLQTRQGPGPDRRIVVFGQGGEDVARLLAETIDRGEPDGSRAPPAGNVFDLRPGPDERKRPALRGDALRAGGDPRCGVFAGMERKRPDRKVVRSFEGDPFDGFGIEQIVLGKPP